MTNAELVHHYFPEATNDEVDYILWEHTGFPCFFHTNKWYPTPISRLRKQLRQLKYKIVRRG